MRSLYRLLSPKAKSEEKKDPSVSSEDKHPLYEKINDGLKKDASLSDMLIAMTEIKDGLLDAKSKEKDNGQIALDLINLLMQLEEKIKSFPDKDGKIALDASGNKFIDKAFILKQIEFILSDQPQDVYGMMSWEDKGNKHYFIANNMRTEGGEAEIHFGYEIRDDGSFPEKVFRVKKPSAEDSNFGEEIAVTKILYSETSSLIKWEDKNGDIKEGYIMDTLPGFDFLKAWKYDHISINKDLNDADKPHAFQADQLKLDEVVLSNHYIYWVEQDLNGNLEVKSKNWREEKSLKSYIPSIEDMLKESVITEPNTVKYFVDNVAKCRPGMGLNCTEFVSKDLTELQRLQVMRDVLQQLSELHKSGYYHGDINPTNIKIHIDEYENAHGCLFDFGKAKKITEVSELTEGMPSFIAPQGVHGMEADMYAIGGIMGMMFTSDDVNPNAFISGKLNEQEKFMDYQAVAAVPYDFQAVSQSNTAEPLTKLISNLGMQNASTDNEKRLSSERAHAVVSSLCTSLELQPIPVEQASTRRPGA